MVGQRGSILVAVLALSIALSMAAASLMLVAGNSRNDEDLAFRRRGCYLDAESGLMMGVEWLRVNSNAAFITGSRGWTGNTLTLFADQTFDNNSLVTVTVTDLAPAAPPKTVTARAVNGSEVVQVSWDVDVDAGGGNAGDGYPKLTLKNWRSP
jgi:hypothetical protein